MQPNANSNMMNSAPQTTPINPGGDIVFNNKPKKNKGMVTGLIILAMLATGGIAFGVWAYLDGNQKTANLNNQISDLKSQLANQPEIDETVIDVDTDSEVNTSDYIYIGEWGLKINTNEQLKNISYYFDYRSETEGEYLYINGVKSDVESIPSFLNTSTKENWLACLSRYPTGTGISADPSGSLGELVFSDDNYSYYYGHPQSTYSSDQNDIDLEIQTVELMKQLFTNKDNYSRI